jgi:hypothetical protein
VRAGVPARLHAGADTAGEPRSLGGALQSRGNRGHRVRDLGADWTP